MIFEANKYVYKYVYKSALYRLTRVRDKFLRDYF